jgi:solute carrier family 35, member F1/2
VLAFSYTTITSVTLLDALAIPSAMILSRVFLKREYTRLHLIGAGLCMLGVILNVFQDYEDELNDKAAGVADDDKEFPHKVKGDLIAVAGGILFGASSVVGEVAVRDLGGPHEYLGMLGFFATIICIVQTIAIEGDAIAEFINREDPTMSSSKCKQATARVILATFVLINVINYLGRAWFLQISEAAFLNLSLLTGDMWSVMFSVFAEHIAPHAFFYVALSITLSGVLVYEMAPSPVHDSTNKNAWVDTALPIDEDEADNSGEYSIDDNKSQNKVIEMNGNLKVI